MKEKQNLFSECGKLQNQITKLKQDLKKTQENEKHLKDESKQREVKFDQIVAKLNHEIKKKENEFDKIKEHLRKLTNDKVYPKNGIEISKRLDNKGFEIYNYTGENELAFMLKKGYEQCQKQIIEENKRLKDTMQFLQKELKSALDKIIEDIKNRESGHYSELEALQVKPVIYEMPMVSTLSDISQIFRENINRLTESIFALHTIIISNNNQK